jgi:site-specific DNA recombinase
MRQAREGDPDDPFTHGLRQSYNDSESQKKASLSAIADLDEADEKTAPIAAGLSRLDALPYLAVHLAKAPRELLYELFEVTQLSVHVHGLGEEVTITVKLPGDQLPKTAEAAERISDAMTSTTPKNAADLGQLRSGGCCLYPRWDSNPRYRRERPAS